MHNGLTYNGTPIGEKGDKLSLTSMWKAAGSPDGKEPWRWRELPGTVDFVDYIVSSHNLGLSEVFTVTKGRHGATWAHWQIGMAYAKYLSPEFHAWCNSVVKAHMEGRASGTVSLAERRVRVMELNAANRTMDHIIKSSGRRAAFANLTEVYAKAGLRIDLSNAAIQGDMFPPAE